VTFHIRGKGYQWKSNPLSENRVFLLFGSHFGYAEPALPGSVDFATLAVLKKIETFVQMRLGLTTLNPYHFAQRV
jgi:hypothetical protein